MTQALPPAQGVGPPAFSCFSTEGGDCEMLGGQPSAPAPTALALPLLCLVAHSERPGFVDTASLAGVTSKTLAHGSHPNNRSCLRSII